MVCAIETLATDVLGDEGSRCAMGSTLRSRVAAIARTHRGSRPSEVDSVGTMRVTPLVVRTTTTNNAHHIGVIAVIQVTVENLILL